MDDRTLNMAEYSWTIKVSLASSELPRNGGLEERLFRKVCDRFPEFRTSESFLGLSNIPESDPRVAEFISGLRGLGVRIPDDRSLERTGVALSHFRRFSQVEIDAAPLFDVTLLKPIIAEIWWMPDGSGMPYVLKSPALRKYGKREWGHAFGWNEIIFVRGAAKTRLEGAGLKGLQLIKLPLVKGKLEKDQVPKEVWPEDIDPLYLVWSRVELPPITNWLFDNAGRVFASVGNRGPFTDGCMPLEEYFILAQFHYRKAEIDALGDFDVAVTYERYGSKDIGSHRRLVVKPRFREAMSELGFDGLIYKPHCVDTSPWQGGVDGPSHRRLSGPPPAAPRPAW